MIEFTKIHGNGNDFIVIDEVDGEIIPDSNKADFAVKYCARRFGAGGDGVIYVSRPDNADLKMRLFQPDASEAEMCGNGIRCLVKYGFDSGYISLGTSTVDTMSGILKVSTRKDDTFWVKVDMGRPLEKRGQIPAQGDPEDDFIDITMHDHQVSVVNTGVPHAVAFVDNLDIDLMKIAPKIRFDKVFPKGANVNFVKVESDSEITVRTYERGVEGETLSCGTGSVAAAYVAHKKGMTGKKVQVRTKGGELNIVIEPDTTYMEGPAETVYKGVILK